MNHFRIAKTSKMMQRDFTFGVATSSYQIEGSRDSRLKANWDSFCEKKGNIADSSNGDISCQHVLNWQEDLSLIDELAVDAYRLSISWC